MGDGTKAVGNNIVHHYRRPGTYAVKVRAVNPYGQDSYELVVDVRAERNILAASLADGATRERRVAAARNGGTVAATNDVVGMSRSPRTSGSREYYSWVIETHLDRSNAERAVSVYKDSGVENVRVYIDRSGVGSTAYRVVQGKYSNTRRALNARGQLERIAKRRLSLIAIGETER
jgi:PKD repeat protein